MMKIFKIVIILHLIKNDNENNENENFTTPIKNNQTTTNDNINEYNNTTPLENINKKLSN